jgi:hypothetical protein
MNERIKQITGQVLDEIVPYTWTTLGYDKIKEIQNRTAELIVRECALVAKTLPHTPERHWVQDSVTYIPVHCEQNILKHFGVEE